MIDIRQFGNALKQFGFSFFTGVPCSFLKDLINFAINECEYIAAANEGDAAAIASGAFLGGKKSVVLMQNSGLGNAVSPLTSLNFPLRIPVLGFVSLRGEPGLSDEPQHELMGQITGEMLSLMRIKWTYLSRDLEEAKEQLIEANRHIDLNESFFFIVRKGTFSKEALNKQGQLLKANRVKLLKDKEEELPSRYEVLKVINRMITKNTIQLATTGMTGRELYEIEDSVNNLYMVGSMGCVSSLALGLSFTRPDKAIVAIDGDGALLMRMGSLAVNGAYGPENMLHILLDNSSYDSTGGQSTVASSINFVETAAACSYTSSIYVHDLEELEFYINKWKIEKGLTFLYLKIAEGSKEKVGRPKLKPYEIKERLKVNVLD